VSADVLIDRRTGSRVRQQARVSPGQSVVLLEFGDFPMMSKMLRGLKTRAEAA
jgi:hypothetical protein